MPDKEEWVDLGPVSQFQKSELTEATLGRSKIAISWRDGRFGAVGDTCNHAGGPLGKGAGGEELPCVDEGAGYGSGKPSVGTSGPTDAASRCTRQFLIDWFRERPYSHYVSRARTPVALELGHFLMKDK